MRSGIDTYGDTHGRFGLSFYIYALLFVAFDIEVIFIYLWAIVFRDLLIGGFVEHVRVRGDPPARARLRMAQGSPDVAMTPDGPGAGAPPAEPTDALEPGATTGDHLPAVADPRDLAEALVVAEHPVDVDRSGGLPLRDPRCEPPRGTGARPVAAS